MTPLWYGGAYSGGAASGAVDWDTYENGIWQEVENHPTVTAYTTNGYSYVGALQLKNMTTNQSTWGDYITGWWSYSNRPTAALSSGYAAGDAPPYVAVWDCDLGQWLDVEPFAGIGSNRAIYDDGVGNRMFQTYTASKTNNCVFVALSEDPGDISGWRDYDGPDDWDTWSDGVFKWAYSGLSYFKELKTPDTYNGTTGLIAFSRNGSYHGFRYNPNVVADAANTAPYLALWHIEGGTWKGYYPRQPIVDWFGTQNGSLYIPTNGAVSYGNTYIVVPLHREPTNFANWRDYDGPLFESWDEATRITLMGGASTVGTTRINIDTYEEDPFWTTISTSGTYELIPAAFDRNASNGFALGLVSSHMDRDRLNSNVTSAAVWFANSIAAPYNGWINVPLDGTGNFKTTYSFNVSPHVLYYNNFYSYAPASLIFYDEEIGDTRYWPAYDGPVANWDTYANGVYIIGTLNTSQNSLIPVPAYPASTYSVVPAKLRVWPMGNNRFAPQETSNYGTYDGDEAPYVAIYITEEADTANAYDSSAKGWYVFKNDTSSAVYNNTTYETPIAWPSDTSTSNPTPGVNEDGYLGSVNNEGTFVVFLDEYNDPLGAGGTDHWTRPPFVIYNDAPYVDSAAGKVYPDSAIAGGTPIIVNDELHADNYVQGMLRDSSSTQFRFYIESHSAYGVADVDIYNNGSLYATSTVNLGNATGSPVLTYIAPQSGFSGYPATAFDTGDGTTGYPIFIIVWTDTDKP